ncbi:MAG: CDP-glucose 4,6-dehydratase [Bacteriovoracaceae bacterium]|nr:CDP-glucose 4,6-dehydratase [Bacteriovoracaceae bacterium]
MFSEIYKGKKILITGHTGFKGSWLTAWLTKLRAEIVGYSIDIPTNPSSFEAMGLEKKITHIIGDVLDYEKLKATILDHRPDFVFHLAAQSIVSTSYENPLETLNTNIMGTATILQCLKEVNSKCVAVLITSDKCYENVEWYWGYKETDRLGGKDIYSASKGAAELIFHSYLNSFFQPDSNVKIASARAGNVIGGGDWAKDRIVADCMRSWSESKIVEIRSPEATRPWQHVLEPLSGYLSLAEKLSLNNSLHGESFNFGPKSQLNHTVVNLIRDLAAHWNITDENKVFNVTENKPFHEAGLLKLNCDKALFMLNWRGSLKYEATVKFTSEWYYKYYSNDENMYDFTMNQLNSYEQQAKEQQTL